MDLLKIQNLKNQAISSIIEAQNNQELEQIRINYLGRNGEVTQLIKNLPSLDANERKEAGILINESKQIIQNAIDEQIAKINKESLEEKEESIDVTAPGEKPQFGHLHIITQAANEIIDIFEKVGFTLVNYPEIEWDWYAFEGLNMPLNHPARDEWETFFIKDLKNKKYGQAVLTPHTSSGQIREMENNKPPIRMLNIAKCYRRQSDPSHAPMFYQFETLVIDKDINITHLKWTLDYFVKSYFGKDRETRIRPFHFQFTEPSFEVDITCLVCGGKGCKVCKEGWMEIGGAGIVHPKVLENGGIDPKKYSGFAWGFGLERVLMMKHGIDDIRLLFGNDFKFIKQF